MEARLLMLKSTVEGLEGEFTLLVLLPLISLDKKLPLKAIEMKSMLESSRTEEAVPYHTEQR